MQQFGQLHRLLLGAVLGAFQQAPAGVLQHRLVAVLLQSPGLPTADLVDRFVHLLHDVETVQNVDGRLQLLGDHVQVGLPHIATDKTDRLTGLVAEGLEEPPQTLLRPLFGHPQQPLHPLLDLIHQRQVMVPPLPLDLVYADGLDPSQILMQHAPENRLFHRLEHVSPGGVEDRGHLLPGQMFGPACQEPAVTGRQMVLSYGPRHSLRRYPADWAIHSPQGIHEIHGNPPQRNELEPPFGKAVVARSRPTAARADRPAILAGVQCHFQRRSPGSLHPDCFSVHKGLERFDPIEDSLQLHPVVAPGEMVGLVTPSLTGIPAGCTCLYPSSFGYTASVWRNSVGLCWRATRQGITRPGRVNDPQAPTASTAGASSFSATPHSFALASLRKRISATLTSFCCGQISC